MISYPMVFSAECNASAGVDASWETSASGRPALTAAIPPEFNGPGEGFSPEDLYCLAACNCYIATFKVIAQNSKLNYESLNVSVILTIDRNEKGIPEFKKLDFKISLKEPSDSEKARRLLEKVSSGCMVLNSLKPEKTFEFV